MFSIKIELSSPKLTSRGQNLQNFCTRCWTSEICSCAASCFCSFTEEITLETSPYPVHLQEVRDHSL
ncbi:hypothetical protein MHYP_G00293450 [Metynnis hypsauchen]